MKTNYNLFYTLAAALLFSTASFAQATIAKWNFNGTAADAIAGGVNAPTPSEGAGTASLVGGTTATFASGNSSTGTTETETTSPPNFGWNTTGYPAPGVGSKTAGVQFNVSTVGQMGITFSFENRHSNGAANTIVLQYTTNAAVGAPVWVDAETFTFTPAATGTGDTWYNGRSFDFSNVTALNNNPNVAFRIVSAFDPVTGDYLASRSTNTYAAPGGTLRFDQVKVSSATTMGLDEINPARNAFTVSPNPSNKEVVSFNEAFDVEVYNVAGKVIFKGTNVSTMDTSDFASGVYFVKNQNGAVQKLIVK
ncbi:Secretion system C-terminal sorting domain-containing protein [Flavobacterium longum]|uniref:T9SS type A sorting domain-containing protein n=1 Tax=Flavobacterium longum TaxID=1299340 RepID=UPI0039EAFFDE